MATRTTTDPFRRTLRAARGDMSKAEAARRLDVEWMTYDMWEKGAWIPGDDHAQPLAEFMTMSLEDVVWVLYVARVQRSNPDYDGDPDGPITSGPIPRYLNPLAQVLAFPAKKVA